MKLADTAALRAAARKGVGVRVPSPAPSTASKLLTALHKRTMQRVSKWIRTGSPHLTDKEVDMGIKELEHAWNTLLCMDGYFLVVRVLIGDLEKLREVKYMRETL